MGFGQDPQLIYHRTSERVDVEEWKWDWRTVELLNCEPESQNFFMPIAALGFCGRIYPFWLKEHFNLTGDTLADSSNDTVDLSLEGLVEQAQRHAKTVYGFSRTSKEFRRIADDVEHHFNTAAALDGQPVETDIFRDLDCPVFIATKGDMYVRKREEFRGFILTNPRLVTSALTRRPTPLPRAKKLRCFSDRRWQPSRLRRTQLGTTSSLRNLKDSTSKAFARPPLVRKN